MSIKFIENQPLGIHNTVNTAVYFKELILSKKYNQVISYEHSSSLLCFSHAAF